MKKVSVKTELEKKFVSVARKITSVEVNSTCPLIAYQPKLPIEAEKLRKF